MTSRWKLRRTLCLATLWVGVILPGRGDEAAETLGGLPLWHPSLELRLGAGYRDNLTWSQVDPQGSGFETLSAEAMLVRLPWEDWQFQVFAAGTDTRYFDTSADVDAEQEAAVSAQFTRLFGPVWRTVTTLDYGFLNQVMDVSSSYDLPERLQVVSHSVTGRQAVRADRGPYFAEAAVAGSRYFLRAPLDDYWQFGPTLTAGRFYGRSSSLTLSYSALPLRYAAREQVLEDGTPRPGSTLHFLTQQADLEWQHHWDTDKRWRTTARLGLERNDDNGSGYHDYWQSRFSALVRYRLPTWELQARASVAHYAFDAQPVSATDPATRRRTGLALGARGERALFRHWTLYAAYAYERSLANREVEEYQVHTASGGIEYRF